MIEQIRQLALYPIASKPLMVWFGLITFITFAFTAYLGYINHKGKKRISWKWHPIMVIVSFIIALIHTALALSVFYSIRLF